MDAASGIRWIAKMSEVRGWEACYPSLARLVINPAVPCMVSTLVSACWQVPTVKSCLQQKSIAGKITHMAHWILP